MFCKTPQKTFATRPRLIYLIHTMLVFSEYFPGSVGGFTINTRCINTTHWKQRCHWYDWDSAAVSPLVPRCLQLVQRLTHTLKALLHTELRRRHRSITSYLAENECGDKSGHLEKHIWVRLLIRLLTWSALCPSVTGTWSPPASPQRLLAQDNILFQRVRFDDIVRTSPLQEEIQIELV